jgi:hypothetical protein
LHYCFGVGLADILTQCSNLKYLRVDCSNSRVSILANFYESTTQLKYPIDCSFSNIALKSCINPQFLPEKRSCFCCDHLDHWKSHEMHLADIQEVEFNGLVGTDCEGWFMQRVLQHAKQLQKATQTFDTG